MEADSGIFERGCGIFFSEGVQTWAYFLELCFYIMTEKDMWFHVSWPQHLKYSVPTPTPTTQTQVTASPRLASEGSIAKSA